MSKSRNNTRSRPANNLMCFRCVSELAYNPLAMLAEPCQHAGNACSRCNRQRATCYALYPKTRQAARELQQLCEATAARVSGDLSQIGVHDLWVIKWRASALHARLLEMAHWGQARVDSPDQPVFSFPAEPALDHASASTLGLPTSPSSPPPTTAPLALTSDTVTAQSDSQITPRNTDDR